MVLHNLAQVGIYLDYFELNKIPKKEVEKLLLLAQERTNDQNKYMGKMQEDIQKLKRIGGK